MTLQNYLSYWESIIPATEALFRLVPPDKIDWKPTDTSFTCGQHMSHMGGAVGVYARGIATGNWGFRSMREILVLNRKQSSLPVEDAIAKLNSNYLEFKQLIGNLTEDAFGNDEVDTPQFGKVPRWRVAMLAIEHHLNHKAELFMYLKLLGINVHTGTLYRV